MTQEEKQLLTKDLCTRLPYRINVLTEDNDKGHIIGVDDIENGVFVIHIIEDGDNYTCEESIENFKPYLRPMSSMTEEEEILFRCELPTIAKTDVQLVAMRMELFLNGHLDFNHLIEKGLALEAPKGMYKTE